MSKTKASKDDAKMASRALELLLATNHISKRELYKQNFIRGLFFSAGTIIGATLILGFGVWVLSLFQQVPVIGPAFETIQRSIEKSQQ